MKEPAVINLSILASAGTGKTFRLSDRIIQLLAQDGVQPDNIAALTFTRAAAAEFIVKLVQKLQEAATDDKKRLKLCERVGIDPLKHDRAWFLRTLRTTLLDSNRMTLGTLDSFFAKLVRCFPLEVGIQTGVATTVSDQDAEALREAALLSTLESLSTAEAAALLASLREYADGELPNPAETLAEMAKEHHELIVTAPEEAKWGRESTIWPADAKKPKWVGYAKKDLTADWEILSGAISAIHGDKPPEEWPTKLSRLPSIVVDLNPSQGELNKVLGYLDMTMRTKMGTPSHYRYDGKDRPLDARQSDAARRLLFQAMDKVVEAKLRQTRALYKCLAAYEQRYDVVNRKQGQLGFSDYVTLLTRAPEFEREQIAFRLDGAIRHWLLDEFQDTSTLQFKVLSKTVEDILGSPKDGRSVFVVGDLKQSLYEWRSGNRRLLEDLNGKIHNPPFGKSIPLDKTRRCAQAVLDLVNQVLTLREVGEGVFPNYFGQQAARDWSANFQRQESLTDEGEAPKKGESYWYRLAKKDSKKVALPELVVQATWIAKHLRETPDLIDGGGRLKHGITCAILVPKNDQAAAIAEVLRKNGVEASEEAKAAVIEDNPVTAGLAGIIRAIVHPDNGLQRGLAETSPASKSVIDALGGWPGTARVVTELFHADGAEAMVDLLIKNIGQAEQAQAFVAKRLRQLRNIAVRYDGTGRRGLADFADYLGKNLLRDNADPRTVQVLTIHRSKGLEYDIVYMPCLNDSKRSIAHLRDGDLLSLPTNEAKGDFSPKWLLVNVGSEIASHDDTLRAAVERARAEAAYGSLCKLYVGTTRARHRLVMLTMPVSEDKEEQVAEPDGRHDFATLLESQLGREKQPVKHLNYEGCNPCELLWESPANNPGWLEERIQAQPKKPAAVPGCRPPKAYPAHAALELLRPSKSKPAAPPAARASAAVRGRSKLDPRELGNAVHALLEHLETDIDRFKASLPTLSLPAELDHARKEASEIVLGCVESEAFRQLIAGLSPEGVLWKEREMAVVTEPGKYVYGKSDRIHVEPGKSATVVDYKTVSPDTTDAELAETYRGQMSLYREAVAKLADVPKDKVRCVLIHVRKGTVVPV